MKAYALMYRLYITSVQGLRPFTSAQRRELCNGNDYAIILTDFHKDIAILVDR